MTAKTCLKIIAAALLVATITAATTVIFVQRLLDLDTYRVQFLSMAQNSLNRRVSYETASFSWHFSPSFDFRGVTVAEKSGDATFMRADRLSFKLALLPLLHKEVHLREIVVERPVLVLDRNRAGSFNIDDLITGKPSEFSIHLKSIRIKNALVSFTDRMVDPEGLTTSLTDLDLYASNLAGGDTSEFKLSTVISDGKGNAAVSISGEAHIPAHDEPLNEARFDVTLTASNLDPGRYWPYYGRYLPFERVSGYLDIEAAFKGKPTEFSSKGGVRIRNLRFDYPEVFHAILTPGDVRLAYEVELTPRDLAVKSLDLTVDGLRVTGSCTLGDIHSKDMRINARAATSPFRLEEFRQYIPYGVIVKGTADFIEQHITGGIYRLDEGRLNGRVSRILHMERGDNYNVLSIRGRVDKGVVTFGPQVPAFSNIRGELEMRGKDFLLRGMSGNFGASPFTLEGKIADYPLDKPSSYPFTMEITPGEAEVAWLFRQEQGTGLAFGGRSLLRLSGSGTAADYRLAGSWELSDAEYRYREVMHKPAGMTNDLRFTARLGSAEARLEDLDYGLPPLDVTASATYQYDDGQPLTFSIATNRFAVTPLLPSLPWLRKYHPSGTLQAHLNGSGDPAGADGIRLKGDVNVEEFSVRPFEKIKPLNGITGTIHVTEAALETEQLTGKVGNSAVAVTGRVDGFDHPAVDLDFSSPALHPEDLGYLSPGEVPEVKNLSGSVSLDDGHLTIASLSGEVARSKFTLSGEIPDIETPKFTLRVDFPYLRMEDVAPLMRLKRAGAETHPDDIALKARVTSAAGSVGEIPFEHLDTELSLENDRLAVHSLDVGVLGGGVSGSGEADFSQAGGPMYQAHYRLDHLDAAQLLRAADAKPHLTGLLTAEGVLTARGKTREELTRSVHATAGLHLRKGEFVVSTEGNTGARIPYDAVDANLSLEDNVLSVQGVNAGLFGGTVSGNGRADFAADDGPRYQARYRLDRVDAARLMRDAGLPKHLTGFLDAEGELAFRGNNPDELKATAEGNADITLTDGVYLIPASAGLKTPHEFPFKKVRTRLSLGRKILDIKSAQIEAFGGGISGNGAADFSTPAEPGYRLACQLQNIDAAVFFRALDATRDLSGRLTMQADVTARGAGVTALKKTARGSLQLRVEKGVINKFGLLSKVFSVLNMSELVDFRLPDMVSSGMPYDHIDGTFSLLEGTVATKDLSMHSPSLNMTIVGNADLVSRDIDLKIGVQPLQAVGKVVNRIPVIGWLLTGGKKSWLVVYYDAKGTWDDPKVSTIPDTALSRGMYNIFKRAFNLPEALITEPGKVLMGE